MVCLPTAVVALAVRAPELLYGSDNAAPAALQIGAGEVKEFFYALFLFIYLLSALCRAAAAGREP
jgi:hypothetical protein